ncbi:MAG TPA: (2Fe-2S)-binding protein [Ktedonobacterales bacterium]|nr:(2Fe-2S)-binding protein [Ktedonobacterales bacterium]
MSEPTTAAQTRTLHLTVNGKSVSGVAEPRLLLSDFLRHELGLTGTHVGCEHGVCGCCTVLYNGEPVRSCLMLAVQADGANIMTVEGLANGDGSLHPIQQAFLDCHGLQCGFCTPGFLMNTYAFLKEHAAQDMTDEEIRVALAGNLCRCTGYQGIVRAVRQAAQVMQK